MKFSFYFYFLLSLLSTVAYGQTTYYVANTGNDTNNGITTTTPLKSLSKVNKLDLQPGDKVLFKSNDIFFGQLDIKNSGKSGNKIMISCYGQGMKPVISGAKQIGNWLKMTGSNNIWVADCLKDTAITGVYLNSASLPLGRFPNKNENNNGYYTVGSHVGKLQMTADNSIPGNWINADLVFRPGESLLENRSIVAQNNNSFKIGYNEFSFIDGWGFFFQNALATLDSDGEWFFDQKTKKLYIYFNNLNPNNQKVEVTYFARGINIINGSNITIQNIEVNKTNDISIYSHNASNLLLNNVSINYSGNDALKIDGAGSNVAITNTTINHTNNNAVVIKNTARITFSNNVIKNCGIEAGRGNGGNGQYTGFQYMALAGDSKIENNLFDSIGYVGIDVRAPNTTVYRNKVSNFCLVKSDGGGIYTWNGNGANYDNIKIIGNFISGGKGDSSAIKNIRPHIHGIYIDDCSKNIEVKNNTVINCQNSGIFLHSTTNVTVDSNKCYNNNVQFYAVNSDKCNAKGNIVSNNIFFSKNKNQPVAIISFKIDTSTLGNFKNNIYYSPDNDRLIVVIPNPADPSKTKRVSLAQWKSMFNIDKLSKDGKEITKGTMNADFELNTSTASKKFSLQGNYKDVDGNSINKNSPLPPLSSKIVIKQQ